MKCISCKGETIVIREKFICNRDKFRRRRECLECGYLFTTIQNLKKKEVEKAGYWSKMRVKDNCSSRQKRWQDNKREQGLCICCGHNEIAKERNSLCDECGERMNNMMKDRKK